MDKGYESEFVYWKENSPNKKSHLPLKGMLNSARIIDNKIFILVNYDDEKLGICVIDPQKNKVIKEHEIPNDGVFFIEGNEKDAFKVIDENTLALAVADNVNQKENSKVMLINTDSLKVEKEITFNEKSFIPLQIQQIDNRTFVLIYIE